MICEKTVVERCKPPPLAIVVRIRDAGLASSASFDAASLTSSVASSVVRSPNDGAFSSAAAVAAAASVPVPFPVGIANAGFMLASLGKKKGIAGAALGASIGLFRFATRSRTASVAQCDFGASESVRSPALSGSG
jgi:hypothetical protein|tara:strand:+ start:538 stop:942 length:405 start_codon:yes stop_codon:yes gene_type:complete